MPAPVVSRERLEDWCRLHLGGLPGEEILRHGYLSTVIGVRLDDGREVVVKVRAPSARLEGCVEAPRRLADAGFPSPQPLRSVLEFDQYLATVDADGGEPYGEDPVFNGPFVN
jgi:hypothetical protein